jgi:hypothetical protein
MPYVMVSTTVIPTSKTGSVCLMNITLPTAWPAKIPMNPTARAGA